MARKYSDAEIAEMLLQIIDANSDPKEAETGIVFREYMGQGYHDLTVERDTLLRVVELERLRVEREGMRPV